jgi:hypothetical protein
MNTITKQEAGKVVKKFGLQERKGKEIFYKLVYNGVTILTTAIPKGRGPLYITDKFRNQLYLDPEQLAGAIKCPFKESHFIAHLKQINLIPDSDD